MIDCFRSLRDDEVHRQTPELCIGDEERFVSDKVLQVFLLPLPRVVLIIERMNPR